MVKVGPDGLEKRLQLYSRKRTLTGGPASQKSATTDIFGGTVNSLCEEPFFSCRQGRGSPPPAAKGAPSPIRAVSEQHLRAVLSLVRRTGRRSSVLLSSRPSAIDLVDSQTMLARGVPGWFVVPLEQSVTLMSPETMHMRQALPNSDIAAVSA
jgi:hypothetical protein